MVETGTVGSPDSRRWFALLTCCSALFMTLLDVSVTNVALPSIADATGAGPSGLQWVVSGYTLSFGLVPVLAGRLGDDHGRKTMFQVGVASFAVTSMLAAVAPSIGFLVAARVLQGLAGGLINPQVSGLVQQMFPGPERGRAFGVLGTTVGVGTALGPLVGGLLIAVGGPDFGWRLAFLVNVPVGVVVILLARRLLPSHPPVGKHQLDVLGAVVLGLALFCILFACVQYDAMHDPRLAWLVVPAAVFLGMFTVRERRLTHERRDPLVDVRLFRRQSYTAGVLMALFFFPAMAGLPLVLALFYQRGLGYSALESALGITAYAAGSALAAPLAGRVVVRLGRPLVIAAAATFGVGAVALAVVATHGPDHGLALAMAPALFLMGVGQGAVVTPNQTLTLMDVDPAVGSTAGGVLQTSQRIGLALGQAIIGATFFVALDQSGEYPTALGFAVGAALCFIALTLVVSILDLLAAGRRVPRGEVDRPTGV